MVVVIVVVIVEMEPGLRVTGHRVSRSAILAGSGRITGQCQTRDPVLSFNMRVFRGVVSNTISAN